MARKLKDIDVEEISLVDAPSNRKKFLIIKKDGKTQKQKAHISIDSDGTVKGTKILVDGEEIKDLADFSFSFYMPRSGEDSREEPRNISCSYSKVTETEDGFKHTDHFYLSKSLEVNKGMKELKELLKDYLGGDFSEEEFEKAEKLSDKVLNALKGALNILNKYKGDFPDELKKAVGVLAKYAGYGYPAKKSDEPYKLEKVIEVLEKAHLEKVGAELSKNTRKQIQKAIDALKKLLEEDMKKDTGDSEIKKELEEIKKSIEKLGEKGEDGDLKKELDKITKRLETIEKAKGIKKSIDGNEDGDGKGKPKWSGFFPEEE